MKRVILCIFVIVFILSCKYQKCQDNIVQYGILQDSISITEKCKLQDKNKSLNNTGLDRYQYFDEFQMKGCREGNVINVENYNQRMLVYLQCDSSNKIEYRNYNDYWFCKYDVNMSYLQHTPKSLVVLPSTYNRYITNDSIIEYVKTYINNKLYEKHINIRYAKNNEIAILKITNQQEDSELTFADLTQLIKETLNSETLTFQEFKRNNKSGWIRLLEKRQNDKIIYLNRNNDKDTFYIRAVSPLYNAGIKIGVRINPYMDNVVSPTFNGGEEALQYYINKHLNHKLIIDKRTLSPRVIVKLIISPQGDVSDIKVLRSIDPILDKEAIRVCRSLPKFVPGRKNGTSDFLPYITTVTFKPDFE